MRKKAKPCFSLRFGNHYRLNLAFVNDVSTEWLGEGFRPQWQGQSRQCILPRLLLSYWRWRNVHHLSDCRRVCWGEKTCSCWWIWQHTVSFLHKIKNSNWPPWGQAPSVLMPCACTLNLDTWTAERVQRPCKQRKWGALAFNHQLFQSSRRASIKNEEI